MRLRLVASWYEMQQNVNLVVLFPVEIVQFLDELRRLVVAAGGGFYGLLGKVLSEPPN